MRPAGEASEFCAEARTLILHLELLDDADEVALQHAHCRAACAEGGGEGTGDGREGRQTRVRRELATGSLTN